MSAQAGICNLNKLSLDRTALKRLVTAIEIYGPDGKATHCESSFGVAYASFCTTPESSRERQPKLSRSGAVITFDGRLDNRADLISVLDESPALSATDIDIVDQAWERWGTDSFRHLVGDWSISIWNPRNGELILATDFLASRHIFYYSQGSDVVWSTDLSSLLVLCKKAFQVDEEYIGGYFASEPDSHRTPFRGIYQVAAGHFVSFSAQTGASARRYWYFNPKSLIRYKTDAEYEEHFRYLFRQSVRRKLRVNGRVLAELSGGLDSSSIVCMADEIMAQETVSASGLDTLSFYDDTEPRGDDSLYFKTIEQKRGRAGFRLDASSYGECSISDSQRLIPIPGYLEAGRPLQERREAVLRSGNYRVVLSGIGGDEFMGGIPDPRPLIGDLIVQFKWLKLSKRISAWSLAKRQPIIHLFWEASADLLPRGLAQFLVKEANVPLWIDNQFARRIGLRRKLLGPSETFGLFLPSRCSYIRGVQLMGQKLAKRLQSGRSLEEKRYPYLDQDLLEFVLAIPADQLLRPGERRSLMRRALAGIVPNEILSRRTKQVGARRHIVLLQNNWQKLISAFASPISSYFGYINKFKFSSILRDAAIGKPVPMMQVMRTISLEFWLRDLASRGLIEVPMSYFRDFTLDPVVQTT